MSDSFTGPRGVGPVNSFSSVSDLSEAISDMSLSTSPGSDNPSVQMKGSVTTDLASPSSEVFQEPEPRPRKRPVMRQLSSNPYLASSEMSPDDHPHSLIMGANSYAGDEGSSERFGDLFSNEQTGVTSTKLQEMRANSYPLPSDFFGESDSDSEEGDEEDCVENVQKQDNPSTTRSDDLRSDDASNNFSASSDAQNISENVLPMLDPTSVHKVDYDSQSVLSSQSHRQNWHAQLPEHHHRSSNIHNHSYSHSEKVHNIHQFPPNHSVMDEHLNNCSPMSSSYPSFQSQRGGGLLYQEGSRHCDASSHYTSQPQSREINSWGHFYKQTESHYKYRRSHYNSSDSDEENFNLYRPVGKPPGPLGHKSRQVSHNHHHKSPALSCVASKSRVAKNQNQISSDTKSSHSVGVKPQVFKDRFQVVKRWFTDCNDGQKNVILKGLLNICELPQLHLLSVHMSRELHQGCPSNCEDLLTWLPTSMATKVMTYLDPVSLCRAAQVCRVWRQLAEDQSLWRRFCCQTKWRLSKAAEHKQVISHMSSEGSIQWKNVFAERFRLRNNWLTGRCTVRTFEGHLQGISCVQFDDSRIVSGSSDKTIKVWNMRTNAPWSVQTLMGHHGTVRCLHLDGNRLVSGSCDTTIKVWDLSTQDSWSSIACKVTMTGHTETVRCLQADDDKVISGSYDKTLKIWDLKSGQLRRTLRGHQGSVLCVHFSETKIVSGSKDKTIKLWNYEGHCTMTLKGHQDAVTCLMFDSTRIVSGSLDHNLKFWDVHSGECLNTIDWKKAEGHTGVVRCLQADSWRVVSAADDKTIKVWNLATGERLITLRNHTDGVTCLQFNDFIIVSGSYDKSVKLWDFTCC